MTEEFVSEDELIAAAYGPIPEVRNIMNKFREYIGELQTKVLFDNDLIKNCELSQEKKDEYQLRIVELQKEIDQTEQMLSAIEKKYDALCREIHGSLPN